MERKCRTLLCIQSAFLVIIIISEKYVVYLQFYFCNPVALANICFSPHSYKLCKNTSVLGGTVINPILRPRRKVPPPIDLEKYTRPCDETWHVLSMSLA